MESNISALRRRVLVTVGAAALLAAGGLFLPGLSSADAHTCAEVRVFTGSSTPTTVVSCHTPCPEGHDGGGTNVVVEGYGAGFTVCIG